jgi:L-lactate utilization protein LutC
MDSSPTRKALEHGDRHAFVARATTYSSRGGGGHNAAHPLPASPFGASEFVPLTYTTLDDWSAESPGLAPYPALTESFARNATAGMLNVLRCDNQISDDQLRSLVNDEQIKTAVVSKMPGAQRVGERLVDFGVTVQNYSPSAAVHADLGISEPRFGIAATGSLVQDSSREGGRGMSLVPRIHLALLPERRILADTAAALATFQAGSMPANMVLISGPSRTGDIEMILTVGVHGPIKVIVALLSES